MRLDTRPFALVAGDDMNPDTPIPEPFDFDEFLLEMRLVQAAFDEQTRAGNLKQLATLEKAGRIVYPGTIK
jgi:hypothetical protein